VHAYVAEHALEHVSDPSNADERYLRARLRRELWPLLLRENPQINKHLGHLADDARDATELLAAEADRLIESATQDLQALRDAGGAERRRALKRWVEGERGCALQRQHIVALERMLWAGGEARLPGGVLAKLEAGRLTFVPVTKRGRGAQRPSKESNGDD
jgi:tRNA(Ile)-lysidine synthase